MTPILIFTIIILAAAVAGLIVFAQREAKKHETSTKEEFVGICKSAIETASQKEMRKERALAFLRERDPSTSSGYKELGNAEIRTELGVSSRTVVKYMDELEREGKVKQVGTIGHTVTYRLK